MSRATRVRSLKKNAYLAQKDLHKYAAACVSIGILYPKLSEQSLNPFLSANYSVPSYARRLVVETLSDWRNFFRMLEGRGLIARPSVPLLLGGPIEGQLSTYSSGVVSASVQWFELRDQLHSSGVSHAYTYLIECMARNLIERRTMQDYISDGTPTGVWRD